MTTSTPALLDTVTTGKAIRAALKAEFPGVKFSVRMCRSTGSFRISWTDGPRQSTVSEFARGFAGKSFDGMTDSESYTRATIEWQGVRHESGAAYVFASRDHSDELKAEAAALVARYWPGTVDACVARCLIESADTLADLTENDLDEIAHHFGLAAPATA